MSKLDYKDVAYYGKPITSLTKAELLEALFELAGIVNDCPVKGDCKDLIDKKTIE
ncbi:MAG: hypothetical protein JRJ41_06405 [Deltaproteobacteria bacterium]|nr:hypothetical protein [Deltaproteobacteria bacterium]